MLYFQGHRILKRRKLLPVPLLAYGPYYALWSAHLALS